MRYATLLLIFVLAGCSQSQGVSVGPSVPRAARMKIDDDRAREAPTTIVHKVTDGELVVMTVPTGGTAKRLDVQRCFLWRDTALKTTAMSCPSDQQDTVDSASSSYPGDVGYNP
jgi:hypothetical protein